MKMSKKLHGHIRNYVKISDAEFKGIIGYFDEKLLRKRELLLKPGDCCEHLYFVSNGCLNMYFLNEKGVNQSTQIAIENWWISDFLAFTNGRATDFFIEAVEDSQVLALSKTNLENISINFPAFEKYLRIIYQIAYGASLVRLRSLYGLSKAERYQRFVEKYPEFVQRVPQYLLASFLGLTKEYVSELRAKMRY